ncbi:MAG: hypothetical protein HDR42_00090 [Lactobacillus sp.]|nr:hypothetical protein [Lactobacillus sp.]
MKKKRLAWPAFGISILMSLQACSKVTAPSHHPNTQINQTILQKNKLSVEDVVNKIKNHPINNGYLNLNMEITLGNDNVMKSNIKGAFKNKPFIVEMNTKSSAGEVRSTSKNWVDSKNIYLAPSNNQWYKVPIKNNEGILDVKSLKENLQSNIKEFIEPSDEVLKKLKLTNQKDKYVLSLEKVDTDGDKVLFKNFVQSTLSMTGQNSTGQGISDEILKDAHLKKLTMKEVINKETYQVESQKIFFEMTYKGMQIKECETIDKIGNYQKLDVPTVIKNAPSLSEDVINKMNVSNNTNNN